MSDPLRDSAYFEQQRRCKLCDGGIAEQRPVFLLVLGGREIVGPYHAGCAARLSLEYAKAHKRQPRGFEGDYYGQLLPREETLPE